MSETKQKEDLTVTEQKKRRWVLDPYLLVILLLTLFLYGWAIWQAGSANSFYTAAITSMTLNYSYFLS